MDEVAGTVGYRPVKRRGDMHLSSNDVGFVVQGLARCIVDREEGHSMADVQKALMSPDFDETAFWEYTLGPAVDRLTEILFGLDEMGQLEFDLGEDEITREGAAMAAGGLI